MPEHQALLKSISSILDELNSARNCERILHNILDQLVKSLNCKTCAIVELNPITEFLEIRNFYNLSWNFCKNYRKTMDTPLLRELIWNGVPINIPDKQYASRVIEQLRMKHDFKSAYAINLIAYQQPLGFLYVDSDEINYFTEERQQIVDIFAKVISTCLYLERLTGKLKRLDRIDEDSGALRFDYYLSFLKENFHRSSRMNEPYSFLLIDIEKYGSIMTLYGLDVTRSLLREMVGKIKEQLRRYDEICRFGADEFLISLPATGRDDAVEVAKKICDLFTKNTFTSRKIRVNVFVGVVSYPQNSTSLNGLLIAAKNALQAAKRMSQKPRVATVTTVYE